MQVRGRKLYSISTDLETWWRNGFLKVKYFVSENIILQDITSQLISYT